MELDQDNNWDDALPDEWRQTWLDAAESALYAMIPHLRAMIAQEIREEAALANWNWVFVNGLNHAAQIAKGNKE